MNYVMIISMILLCALLAIKRFYIARSPAAKLSVQYWDRITSTLAIIVLLSTGYIYLPGIYFKIGSLILGLFIYLCATPIAATKKTRWTDITEFDSNPEYSLFSRGRFNWNTVKLYFTPIKANHCGTQWHVINLLKGCGTILMTGVIPELLSLAN